MSRAHNHKSSATSSSKRDDLLDLFERLRTDVGFWSALEGPCPGMMRVCRAGAESDVGICASDFLLNLLHLAELEYSSPLGECVVQDSEFCRTRRTARQPQLLDRLFIIAD